MYGLLMDKGSIDRMLSGQVNEFWCTRYVNRSGKMALVEIETGRLRGFGNLDNISEMPYSEYYKYYGMKHHYWESVPSGNGNVRAYRYVFSNIYPVTDAKRIDSFYAREDIMILFDEAKLGPIKKQSSLFDF